MRVFYFSHGLTVHDVRFLAALSLRHEVVFLSLHRHGGGAIPAGVQEIDWPGRPPSSSGPEPMLDRIPQLKTVLEDIRPDVVQAGPIQTCAFMIAQAGFSPLIAVSWGSDLIVDADRSPDMRWKTAFALDRAAALFCDADQVRNIAVREFSVSPGRVVQFPWGTDLDQFFVGPDQVGLRERFGWESAKVFLSTRSWEPLYGIVTMLEAFRQVRQSDSSAHLVLLGGGSQSALVHQYLEEHGLGAAVTLPGLVSREELPHFFRASDFYVSCSHSDGTSVSLLEAQASGLPVIVSDLPSNREWVEEEVNGWLAPAGDATAFAAMFRRACALAPADRDRIARANRAQAEARADWRKHARTMLDGIERVVGRPRS